MAGLVVVAYAATRLGLRRAAGGPALWIIDAVCVGLLVAVTLVWWRRGRGR